MNRYDRDLIEDGYLGLGYRFNRPFGSVAPLSDHDFVMQRTNEKGEIIGLFAKDIHHYHQTAIARDINNVRKRRS